MTAYGAYTLFSGDVDNDYSEIRRYILVNDLLDGIIQLSIDDITRRWCKENKIDCEE